MSKAYSLLGLLFLIVFVGAYIAVENAYAPNNEHAMSLTLSSPAFEYNGTIPAKYTCDGENISPEIHISGIPEGTQSLVLVMDDPDIPQEIKDTRGIEKFDHWVVYNIPADTTVLKEGESVGTLGLNSRPEAGYAGACPPPEYQPTTHRYIFRLYALSGTLNFIKTPTLYEVEEAAKGMMLEQAELIGIYDRSTN